MAYNIGPKIVTNGLVAAYDPSNPKSGDGSIDLSNNGRNLTLNDVNVGGSGVRKYLQNTGGGPAAETGYTPTGVWTIDLWFTRPSTLTDDKLVSTATGNSCVIGLFESVPLGPIYPYVNGPRNVSAETIVQSVVLNDIINYTAYFNTDGNLKFYIDGILKLSDVYSDTLETLQPLTLLSTSGDTLRIHRLNIYNRELSAAEVLQNHNALRSRFGK